VTLDVTNFNQGGRGLTDNTSEKNEKLHTELISEPEKDMHCDSYATNEKLIIIVIKSSGLAPYSHEFSKSSLDPQIVSGFISAMTSFMGEMMGEHQTHWKTEYGSESLLLVEQGEWAIGVLAVSRETNEVRRRLSRVVHEFEDYFAVLRNSDGIEGSAMQDFDECTRKIFVNDQITGRTLVIKRPEWRKSLYMYVLPSTAFAIVKALLGFEEKQAVSEIAKFQGLCIEDTIDLVSTAYWYGAVSLKYIPPDEEILILSEKSSTILFQKDNPLGLSNISLNVIARFDGRATLFQLAEYIDVKDFEVLLDELGTLVNRGYIQRISSEQRRVLFNESFLSSLVSKGALIVGEKKMKQCFDEIRKSWGDQHPRIYRITLTDRMRVRCIIDENMTPDDLDELSKTLELFVEELSTHLSTICGSHTVEKLLSK
jgi:hypothetical protein